MHHPIYSSSLQSPPCQPLAQTDDGQTPAVHKLCKGNKCTQQTVWPAWPWGSSCPLPEGPGLSWANGSLVSTSCMQEKQEGKHERALSTALGLDICAAPIVCRTHSALAPSACPPIRQFVCRGNAIKGEGRCLLLRLETELEQLHVVPMAEGHCGHCAHTQPPLL